MEGMLKKKPEVDFWTKQEFEKSDRNIQHKRFL